MHDSRWGAMSYWLWLCVYVWACVAPAAPKSRRAYGGGACLVTTVILAVGVLVGVCACVRVGMRTEVAYT